MIKVTVEGKQRLIRDRYIHSYQEGVELECTYKDCDIWIKYYEDENDFLATVRDESGSYLVDGGWSVEHSEYKTLEDVLVMCIREILI